jgi:hypothetical protein
MRHGMATVVWVCASLIGGHFAGAADQNGARLRPGEVVFRCVKTPTGPMIEAETSTRVFQFPRLKVRAGQWFGEGELHPKDESVEWTGVNGVKLIATSFLFNSADAKFDGPRPRTGFALRSLKTPNGQMVAVKARGVVALAPSLMFVDGHREVEIRPIGNKLGMSDGKSTATFAAMSLEPRTRD